MTKPITVEVSAGELIDKLTILEIKASKIKDVEKLRNVHEELNTLRAAYRQHFEETPALRSLVQALTEVNERLWHIEDEIRECERRQDFSDVFTSLARAVYLTNDRRAELKREINVQLGSRLKEEKSYSSY